jgi:hypothetical protein
MQQFLILAPARTRSKRMYNVVFVDQVSAAIPVLLLLTRSKVCTVGGAHLEAT